jgi:hypothetical protein
MSAPGIRKHLRRQGGTILLVGLEAVLLGGSLLAALGMVSADKGAKEAPPILASVVFLSAALATLGVIVGWKAVREVRSWRRHPDVLALARYGPPEEVVAAVDAELAVGRQVRRLGDAYLTASWLVHLPRDGAWFGCLRLDSIVRACGGSGWRSIAPGVRVGAPAKVVFEDRHGSKLSVFDEEACVIRLLAEVLARVPGVLARFGEEPGPEGSEHVLAAGRREEGVRPGQGSPDGIVG